MWWLNGSEYWGWILETSKNAYLKSEFLLKCIYTESFSKLNWCNLDVASFSYVQQCGHEDNENVTSFWKDCFQFLFMLSPLHHVLLMLKKFKVNCLCAVIWWCTGLDQNQWVLVVMEKGVWSLMDAFNGDEMRSMLLFNVHKDYGPEEAQAGI